MNVSLLQKIFSKKRGGHALVLDIGTTGVKALVFSKEYEVLAKSYKRLHKTHPRADWVEQDPQELLTSSIAVLREAIKNSRCSKRSFAGFGITNQRETTILWNRLTRKALAPAIVWEDKRTKKYCKAFSRKKQEIVQSKTGLAIDSYFSASKIRWLLNHVQEATKLLEKEHLAFGTVDAWLLSHLIVDHPHVTDETNASRTLLYNICERDWDGALLDLFDVPSSILPRVFPSQSYFGELREEILGCSLPVLAVCGDQQSSLFAAGENKGDTKVTFGTGTFLMQILGKNFSHKERFFTTLTPHGHTSWYALEAKIEETGARVQALLRKPQALEQYMREVILQLHSLIDDLPVRPKKLTIDGGITQYKKLLPLMEKIIGIPVKQQVIFDGTAMGIAKMIFEHKE